MDYKVVLKHKGIEEGQLPDKVKGYIKQINLANAELEKITRLLQSKDSAYYNKFADAPTKKYSEESFTLKERAEDYNERIIDYIAEMDDDTETETQSEQNVQNNEMIEHPIEPIIEQPVEQPKKTGFWWAR